MFGWKHWASIGRVSALCKESHLSPLSYHCLHLHYTLTLTIVTIVIVTIVCIYTITILITLIIVIIVLQLFACDPIENKEEEDKKVDVFFSHVCLLFSWTHVCQLLLNISVIYHDKRASSHNRSIQG